MESLDLYKIASTIAVAAITAFIKLIYNLLSRNNEKLKIRSSSVELIDKLINERDWKKPENRIIIEEAFEQLYLKPLSYFEIKVLLYAQSPSLAFRTYFKYRPLLELNDRKNKIRYKQSRKPYWYFFNKKLRVPKEIIKGFGLYLLFAMPVPYLTNSLLGNVFSDVETIGLIILWVLNCLLGLIAVIFLVEGLRYHDSEKEILKNLKNQFQFN